MLILSLGVAATSSYITLPPPYSRAYSVGGPTGEVHLIDPDTGGFGEKLQQVLFVPESELEATDKTRVALVCHRHQYRYLLSHHRATHRDLDRMELSSHLLDNMHLCPSLALVPLKCTLMIVLPVVLRTLPPCVLLVGQKRMTAHDMSKSTLTEKFYIVSRNTVSSSL